MTSKPKVTLTSTSTIKGQKNTSTRSGVAGGSNGTLVYNIQWKHPKPGVQRSRGSIWK